jgi:ABC-type multidrug transport system fused ATPase/permease subunit
VLRVIAELRGARRRGDVHITDPQPLLSARDVQLSHGNDVVVRDLDLAMEGPGGVAIVGPSGSGKSTTLTALAGLSLPVSGSVDLDGMPMTGIDARDLGRTVGFLPQDPHLVRGSLRANVVRGDRDADLAALVSALDAGGLDQTVAGFHDGLDTPMGRAAEGFSGGELQRLGLARLLVNQPDVWLLDEPTSALDRANSERVVGLVAQAMDDHLVVVVTHRPEILRHCGRIVFMADGRVVDDGPLEDVIGRQPFVAAMVGSGIHELSNGAPGHDPHSSIRSES